MATIEDLNIESLIDKSHDEGIEQLRQIRLSRRTTPKKAPSTKKASTKPKKVKKLAPNQAAEALKIVRD